MKLDSDLLGIVLKHLTRRDAVRTSLVCRAFSLIIKSLENQIDRAFPHRVFLGCSRLGKICELSPTGQVLLSGRWQQRKGRTRFQQGPSQDVNWITGLCINPCDGDLYACQHSEGVAFAHGCMYVQSIRACITRLKPDLRINEASATDLGPEPVDSSEPVLDEGALLSKDDVPNKCPSKAPWVIQESTEAANHYITWGLCYHDGYLYSAADNENHSKIYTAPPSGPASGCVLRLRLGPNGQLGEKVQVFTNAPIRRPSGLRFDQTGRLWITSMDPCSGLMCFSGANSSGYTPGTLLASFALEPVGLYPWDVVVISNTANRKIHYASDNENVQVSCVVLQISMHCGRTVRGLKQEKNCWLTTIEVAEGESEGSNTGLRLVSQTTAQLPADLDHTNALCLDL